MAQQRIHKTKSKRKNAEEVGSVEVASTSTVSREIVAKCTETVLAIDAVLAQNRRY